MNDSNWIMIGALGQWFAGIATFAAVWIALRSQKPNISINIGTQIPVSTENELGRRFLTLQVLNQGTIPIQICNVYIIMGTKNAYPRIFDLGFQQVQIYFPFLISPHTQSKFSVDYDEIYECLDRLKLPRNKKIYLACNDSFGKIYKKSFRLD